MALHYNTYEVRISFLWYPAELSRKFWLEFTVRLTEMYRWKDVAKSGLATEVTKTDVFGTINAGSTRHLSDHELVILLNKNNQCDRFRRSPQFMGNETAVSAKTAKTQSIRARHCWQDSASAVATFSMDVTRVHTELCPAGKQLIEQLIAWPSNRSLFKHCYKETRFQLTLKPR